MKVLHIQKVTGIGGSERHLLSLLPGLAELGVEVRMCVLTAGRSADFTKQLRAGGTAHTELAAGPDLNPLLLRSIRREVDDFEADLVHTHLIHADLHGQIAARLAGVPGVSSVHGTHGFYRRRPYRSAARLAGRRAQRTIAISEHVGRFVEELGLSRPGSTRVVRYGIDAAKWSAPGRGRESLGLGGEDVAVGVASRLVPHKGHSFLLRAFAGASQRDPRLRLLVAGDGPLRKQLEREAQALGGRVEFLGFVADIQGFLEACDILAFPTQPEFGEGFGLAALEAMAAACPVVATAVASLPEVVSAGESGILVDPHSVEELATALTELAASESMRRRMGERGRERAIRVFSLEEMVQRTAEVYAEVH